MRFTLFVLLAGLFTTIASQRIRWERAFGETATFGDPFEFESGSGPVIVVFVTVGSSTGSIVALNASSGATLWTATPPQKYRTPPYSGWCDGVIDPTKNVEPVLYCGLDDGVVALRATDGMMLWRYVVPWGPNPVTPSHPTAVPSAAIPPDFVIFTFENGHHSSNATILSRTGQFIASSDKELVFTKIWRIPTIPDAVTYCSVNAVTDVITFGLWVLNATSKSMHTLWNYSHLPYSPPGLWDNPNNDVDSTGKTIFIYEKLKVGQRSVKQFDSHTGKLLWELNTVGHVVDYDTYAYMNNFYRLITEEATGLLSVEAFNTSEANSTTNGRMWHTSFDSKDQNAILLVGGGITAQLQKPHVVVFGLNTGSLWNFDPATGRLVWSRDNFINISTGIVGADGTSVLFGVGSMGTFMSVAL